MGAGLGAGDGLGEGVGAGVVDGLVLGEGSGSGVIVIDKTVTVTTNCVSPFEIAIVCAPSSEAVGTVTVLLK